MAEMRLRSIPRNTRRPSEPQRCGSHLSLLPPERWMRKRCCGNRGTWGSVHHCRLSGGRSGAEFCTSEPPRRRCFLSAGLGCAHWAAKVFERHPGAGWTLTPRCKFTRGWVSPCVGDAQSSQGAGTAPHPPHSGEKITSIAANITFLIDF